MKFVLKTEKLFLVIKILTNFIKMVSQKKRNHFYEICVENRKIIFSCLNINKFHKNGFSKKKKPFL